jgi:hypothetical protein
MNSRTHQSPTQQHSESSEYYSEGEHKALLELRHNLNSEAAEELYRLLREMVPLKFTRSSQLSHYIVSNRLGYKYPIISGVLRMKNDDKEWNFSGGFPPDIYAIICDELKLGNENSDAIPIKFTSFKQLQAAQMKSTVEQVDR